MRMSLYDPVFLGEISTLSRMNLKFLYNIYNYIHSNILYIYPHIYIIIYIYIYIIYIYIYIYIYYILYIYTIFFQLHPDLGMAWAWTAVSSVWWSADNRGQNNAINHL